MSCSPLSGAAHSPVTGSFFPGMCGRTHVFQKNRKKVKIGVDKQKELRYISKALEGSKTR